MAVERGSERSSASIVVSIMEEGATLFNQRPLAEHGAYSRGEVEWPWIEWKNRAMGRIADNAAERRLLRQPGGLMLVSCYELGHHPLGIATSELAQKLAQNLRPISGHGPGSFKRSEPP